MNTFFLQSKRKHNVLSLLLRLEMSAKKKEKMNVFMLKTQRGATDTGRQAPLLPVKVSSGTVRDFIRLASATDCRGTENMLPVRARVGPHNGSTNKNARFEGLLKECEVFRCTEPTCECRSESSSMHLPQERDAQPEGSFVHATRGLHAHLVFLHTRAGGG